MEPFNCFVDVESFRSYIDEIYSRDNAKCQEALVCLKNAVIGSNRQKSSVISQGLVPKLTSFLTQDETPLEIRMDAAIIIGSLAKGNDSHIHALLGFGVVSLLLQLITNPNTERPLIDLCLCTLRSIFRYSYAPTDILYSNVRTLSHIISLASKDSTIQCQASVANILVPLCQTYNEQMILAQVGAIPFLARLLHTQQVVLQIPALKCLASMCFTNRTVSDITCISNHEGQTLVEIMTSLLSRARKPEIQLAAARCLTYIHRAGPLTSTDPCVVYKTLPCLARLCTEDFDEEIRATAAETLAYLAEIDSELQRLASISNHLISSLSSLLQSTTSLSRIGAFRCFASLGANDEDIRKRIIETDGLMQEVLSGLGDASPDVRLAAVRCLHSLSRSVQQLRTTLLDHSVWRPLMALWSGQPSTELLTVVTSTICNLLLEFSPAKEPIVELGAVEMLCDLTRSSDPALRLNGSWALMNMAFQAEEHIKTRIINTLGTDRIFQLLGDSDTRVIMKTLGLLRNLLSKSMDIEYIMSEHATQVMQAVRLVLDSPHPAEVKEQALCIIGNIAAGASANDYVMEDERILEKLFEFIVHRDSKLQEGAMFAVKNLVDKDDSNTSHRRSRLVELGIISKLNLLLNMAAEKSEAYDNAKNLIRILGFS